MANKAVFCIASSEAQASEIVRDLKRAGFSNNDISALLPDKTGTKDFAHVHRTKAPEGAALGGVVGGGLGGGLGLLAAGGLLAVPGLGPLLAAGPLLATLSAAAVGGLVGGLVGVLVGLGIPEFEAKRYEGKIKEGNILLSVHCEGPEAVDQAKVIFETAGAFDISTSGEASVKEFTRAA